MLSKLVSLPCLFAPTDDLVLAVRLSPISRGGRDERRSLGLDLNQKGVCLFCCFDVGCQRHPVEPSLLAAEEV